MAKREQQELSEEAVGRITRVVHSMVDDRVERGIDLSRAMHCDSCDQERAPGGSAQYGAYKLCNDCLLELTIALASGSVETVADFMTHQVDDGGHYPPPSLTEGRQSLQRGSLHGRDKLMPSNEPA